MKVESGKVGLKLNIQKTKIMESGRITSWPIDGETVETVSDFIFRGSKVTADGDSSHEIKTRLLLGRKVMTNLDSILKSRHYFAKKGPSSQGYGFSSSHVWMWELDHKEGWAPKNGCFLVWVLEKPLESPRGIQSWIFIGRNVQASLVAQWLKKLTLKFKIQYFGHLMWRAAWL